MVVVDRHVLQRLGRRVGGERRGFCSAGGTVEGGAGTPARGEIVVGIGEGIVENETAAEAVATAEVQFLTDSQSRLNALVQAQQAFVHGFQLVRVNGANLRHAVVHDRHANL